MKKIGCALALLLCIATSQAAWFQTQGKAADFTVRQVLEGNLNYVEKSVVSAADAMPAEKYSYAPTQGEFKGVRSFSQLVKHTAYWNYKFASTILQEKPPVEIGGENGPDSLNSKAEVTKFLTESFDYLHKAIRSMDQENLLLPIKGPFGSKPVTRLGMAVSGIDHPFDMYGQMVEYLRMNGIVPPASR